MRISDLYNIYIDRQILELESEIFEEGEILSGEVLELKDEEAIIYIKGFGKIRAFVEMELESLLEKKIDFLVKSTANNKIQLKPIVEFTESSEIPKEISREEMYLIKILEEHGIEEEPMAKEYIQNLIKYNVNLSEKNIVLGIKVLEKLEKLFELDEDSELLVNLKGDLELENEDIRNLIVETKTVFEEKTMGIDKNIFSEKNPNFEEKISGGPNLRYIGEENFKSDIKKDHDKIQNIIKELKEHMNSSVGNKEGFKSDLIKTIVLFSKYNIKPSMNNIKHFLELQENPHDFLEDLNLLEDIEFKKFTNIDKKAIINSESLKNIIEDENLNYKDTIKELEKILKEDFHPINKEEKDKIENLQNKLEFLEEINQELNYVYIPFNLDREIIQDSIIFIKDRKNKKGPRDNINVFINLNTENLGNVKINCQVVGDVINIKFNGLNSEDIDFFKNREDKLKDAMKNTVYNISRIEYESKMDNILDLLIVNKGPIYHLNVGV